MEQLPSTAGGGGAQEGTSSSLIERVGGRKFLISIIGIILFSAIAVLKPEALTETLMYGVLGIVGAFSTSNAALTAFANNRGASPKVVAAPTPPEDGATARSVSQLEADLAALRDVVSQIITLLQQQQQTAPVAQNSTLSYNGGSSTGGTNNVPSYSSPSNTGGRSSTAPAPGHPFAGGGPNYIYGDGEPVR